MIVPARRGLLLGLALLCLPLPAAVAQDQAVRQTIDSMLGDHAKYDAVIAALQKAVKDHDAAAVAALVSYPITVTIDGESRAFATPKDFIANYDWIMPAKIAATIVSQKYGDLFVNAQGISFGQGEVWINGICKDNACKEFDAKVETIQSAPLATGPDCDPETDLRLASPLGRDLPAPQLMTIAPGTDRLHFLKVSDTCPADGADCAMRAFVTPGDAVVVTHAHGAYSCAIYTGQGPHFPETAGWLPTAALQAPAADPTAPAWPGDWKAAGDRETKLSVAAGGALKVAVTSTFGGSAGADDPDGATPGFSATAKPDGQALAFSLDTDTKKVGAFDADPASETLCRAKFWRLGPYLVASDNGCGMPGTGSGVYRQAR